MRETLVDAMVDGTWSSPAGPSAGPGSGAGAGSGAGPAAGVLVLPDGCVDVMEEGGRLVVVGPMTVARWVGEGVARRGVRWRPGRLAGWLGCSLDGLRDRVVPLDEVLGHRFRGGLDDVVEESLSCALGSGSGLESGSALGSGSGLDGVLPRVLAGELLPGGRLIGGRAEVLAVADALVAHPELAVADLARVVGLSARQLQRIFLQEVGMGPRVFARVRRLQRLTGLMQAWAAAPSALSRDLTGWALEAGYADQPHMGRDVRALTGLTPLGLLATMSESFKTG